MKRCFLLTGLLVLMIHTGLQAQSDTIARRIVLIGDAGQLTNGRHPVVDAVRQVIPLDEKTTVLFLGDNLYKMGLPDSQYTTYAKARAVLDSQVSVADNTPAMVYMIPGNHDWENGGRGGYNAIIRQQLYVEFLLKPNVKYYPQDGCPGPKEISIGNNITLILFDSQWWLHPFDKPGIESDCKCKTKEELVNQIGDIVARNPEKLIILACHHPFKSNGVHGGYFTLKQHIFPLTDIKKSLYIPLPVIGSIYPIARSVFGTPQDIRHPNYTNMIDEISAVVKRDSAKVVFVSGHDHNLQLIREGGYNYVVSGGGCKQNRTSNAPNSLFNSRENGFAVMEISTNKNVSIRFYTVSDTIGTSQNFSLLNFSRDSAKFARQSNTPPVLTYHDTTRAITKEFKAIKGLRKYFMGENYRAEWTTPVTMRTLNLGREKGGLKVESLGGGKQTKSLHLTDKRGDEWILRSLDKSPTQTIPDTYRGTLVEDILKELKSASHPYGALIVPGLARALKLSAPQPELFFVPDDTALGFYRKIFANTVCMLEKQNASYRDKDSKSTFKMLYGEMLDDNDHLPVQPDVLRARLLDIMIGDYDRHFDQWRWGEKDTGKGKIYYPIPRDRDQAFFYSDGKLLKMISGHSLPFLKGFRPDIPKVNWLGYTARDFDRLFLTNLDARQWEKEIAEVQQKLSDSVISAAVQQLPPEIYKLHGEEITRKMISRRNALAPAAMEYYRFISKRVNVIGSNQKEYFRITSEGNDLRVRVFARNRRNDTNFVMYDRLFDPNVTKEIRLFGLNDKDHFEIDSSARSRIKIRMIGGQDDDTFDIKGNVEALLYDLDDNLNYIKNDHHAKNRFSKDPPVNDRNIIGFNYNTSKFPQLHFNYNSDDGLLIGAGFSHRTFGFRNLPYATDQKLTAIYAPDRRALQLEYRGEFNHITRNLDLWIRGNFTSPSLNNFFGYGGSSRIDPAKPRRYYQTLYRSFEAEVLLRHRYFDKLHVMLGPYFYSYQNDFSRNKNNVLGHPATLQLDSARVFGNKAYAGGKLVILVDNRNKEFFPTRGIRWYNELTGLSGIRNGSKSFTSFTSDMSIYASLTDPARLIAVLKVGMGKIYSKNFEYFQALTIGSENGLIGFRKNRYSGTALMYGGLELRYNLFKLDSYILPGTLGIAGFYNAARIRAKNLATSKWRDAFGLGIYYLPFNLFTISAYAGFSQGEKMLNFTLGTKFNITY